MATFMLTCDHKAEECDAMSEEQERLGTPDVLKGREFFCSCPYGHHGGWARVEGDSGEAILSSLPPIFRSHAKAYEVEAVAF
ncbi:MAG TPA: hypothetical protein VH951_02910 [Dehalococcoidia bacterium]